MPRIPYTARQIQNRPGNHLPPAVLHTSPNYCPFCEGGREKLLKRGGDVQCVACGRPVWAMRSGRAA